ncbi:MAG: c-type cytochrome biogenesis protein CcsB [Chloroflexi bacterium]|nr:c-type cytochrome biogenesis protein CcsB [Chloroflexota bacterium]
MATLSFYLVVVGAIALVGAFALYVVHLVLVAQGDRAVTPRLAIAAASMRGNLAEQLDGGAPTSAESTSAISAIAGALAVIATGSLGVALIARAIVVGRGPWGNLYEFTISFAFGICAAAIIFDRKHRLPALSTIAYGVALALLAYATTLPNAVVDLVPALQHPFLLTIHVGMAMLSYGIFAFAFAAGVAYLLQGDTDRFSWLPPAKRLDLVAFRAVTVAFPLFAGMLILGSIWASIAWSRFWGWDPKETSALATWLIYAVYLHARSQRGWQGRPAALLLVIGFVAVLLTYSGNLWFTGLHTYSGL